MRPAFYADPALQNTMPAPVAATGPDRSSLPAVETLKTLDFPEIERARLSNGVPVYFARRAGVPVASVRVEFDAGYAADPSGRAGLQSMMLGLMDEGTTRLDSTALAETRERLGANIGAGADLDQTAFTLDAVTPNLAPSLELLADYIRNPAFAPDDLERVRARHLTAIRAELNNPSGIAGRALARALYGDHPYGVPPSGLGEAKVVSSVTRDDLARFHDAWIVPGKAKIFVVGDTALADVLSLLERSFGNWRDPAGAPAVKNFSAPLPETSPRIVLIDRPASPQSLIVGGRVLGYKGTDDLLLLQAANEVMGGGFLSRFNMNLRETKGWSYGAGSRINDPMESTSLRIFAPVQADRTGDSIKELRVDFADFTGGSKGTTEAELERLINGNVRELPGRFETSKDVLAGIVDIVSHNRPDDYFETLAQKYSALTAAQLDATAKVALAGDDVVFVVVGDAAVVRPQLDGLGLPVEVVPATSE